MASEATEVRECLYCHKPYDAKDPKQRFCSRTHKRAYQKSKICPHPEKYIYPTEAVAVAICEMNGWTNQRPYLCRCGYWHTTKQPLKKVNNA